MSTVDNIIAIKVLYMLTTPFDKTEAYKLGVIDKDGKLLVKSKDQTSEQKNAYDYLDRMVFNLKRLIGKIPGGKSYLASVTAALLLIKENRKMSASQLEEKFNDLVTKINEKNIVLVEEEIEVEKFIQMMEDGAPAGVAGNGQVGAPASQSPANVTGAKVSTDIPVIKPKKKKTTIARRPQPIVSA